MTQNDNTWTFLETWFTTTEARSMLQFLHPVSDKLCPKKENLFRIFSKTSPKTVKVVFVGQDPYPQLYQKEKNGEFGHIATGVAFAVPPDCLRPPSLLMIDDERALGYYEQPFMEEVEPTLETWVDQGVMLLNASLTCELGKPEGEEMLMKEGSHSFMWRTLFMEDFFQHLGQDFNDLVFVFCGRKAQYYSRFVANNPSHTVINVVHPVADWRQGTNAFRGSKVFNRVNDALTLKGKSTIEW